MQPWEKTLESWIFFILVSFLNEINLRFKDKQFKGHIVFIILVVEQAIISNSVLKQNDNGCSLKRP